MINPNRYYEKIYAAYLEITILHQPLKYTIREIDNAWSINYMISMHKKYPNIYQIEHWFNTKGECQSYIDQMNKNLNATMIDYFKHRFNVTKAFVLLNKRGLQKLIFYIKKCKKG